MTVGEAKLHKMPISTHVALRKTIITLFIANLHTDFHVCLYARSISVSVYVYMKLFNNQLKVLCMLNKCHPDNRDRDAI